MSLEFHTLRTGSRPAAANPLAVKRKSDSPLASTGNPRTAMDFGTVLKEQVRQTAAVVSSTPTKQQSSSPAPSPSASTSTTAASHTIATTAPSSSAGSSAAPTAKVVAAADTAWTPAALASLPNGGLMSNPTGNNALTGGTIAYNANYYATPEAAAQLAQQLGGTVVDMRNQFSNNQSEYYINLPNGTSINAGNLVALCNNPVYNCNAGVMDHMIAEMLNNNAVGTPGVGKGAYTVTNGQITYDPNGQVATPASPYST